MQRNGDLDGEKGVGQNAAANKNKAVSNLSFYSLSVRLVKFFSNLTFQVFV